MSILALIAFCATGPALFGLYLFWDYHKTVREVEGYFPEP